MNKLLILKNEFYSWKLSRKEKTTGWISKSSKKALKQINKDIQHIKVCWISNLNKYSKLQNITKDNVNQSKHNSKLFIASSACLSVTFRSEDQQRDLLMVVLLPSHIWFQPLRITWCWCLSYPSSDRKGLTTIWHESV